MAEIVVELGEKEVRFDVGVADYNNYINNMMPNDKVAPGFNLLSTTVHDEDKEYLKEMIMADGLPNGFMVMELVAVVIGEVSGGVEINIKKQKGSAKQ